MKFDIQVVGDKELVVYLENITKKMKSEIHTSLSDVGKHLKGKVQEKFGKYQSGWPKLKRASVIAKAKRRGGLKGMKSKTGTRKAKRVNSIGTGGADDPLVLFTKLKSSIRYEVKKGSMEAVVYSDEVYAAVHEYGYKNVPSRSYMRLTLTQEEAYVVNIIKNRINGLL